MSQRRRAVHFTFITLTIIFFYILTNILLIALLCFQSSYHIMKIPSLLLKCGSLLLITTLISAKETLSSEEDAEFDQEEKIKTVEEIYSKNLVEITTINVIEETTDSEPIFQPKNINDNDNNKDDEEEESRNEKGETYKNDTNNKSSNKKKSDNDDENAEGDESDGDGDEEGEESSAPTCDVEFFLEKLIPEDYYPHEPTSSSFEDNPFAGNEPADPKSPSIVVHHLNETIERINRMHHFTTRLSANLTPFLRQLASHLSDLLYEAKLPYQCMGAFMHLFTALGDQKSWAIGFLDASGPLISNGFAEGKFVSLGEFDQCLALQSEPEIKVNGRQISGQYCLVKPVIPLPEKVVFLDNNKREFANSSVEAVNSLLNDEYLEMYLELYRDAMRKTPLRYGLCLPSQCRPEDIEQAINHFLIKKTGFSVTVGPKCSTADQPLEVNSTQKYILYAFAVLLGLVLASSSIELIDRLIRDNFGNSTAAAASTFAETSFDNNNNHQELPTVVMSGNKNAAYYNRQTSTLSSTANSRSTIFRLFTSFSIIRNTRTLFTEQNSSSEKPRLPQLDSLRLLFILFFFVLNAYLFMVVFAPMVIGRFYALGPKQILTEKKYFFLRLYYVLDVFLLYSGIAFMVSFSRVAKTITSSANFYLGHVARTYICYLLPVLFSVGIILVIPLFGSGPLWGLFSETIASNCQVNARPTLFMYSNLVEKIETICNLPSSFISLTFQLQLIGPLLVLAATRYFHFRSSTSVIFYLTIYLVLCIAQLAPRYLFGIKFFYEHRSMSTLSELRQSVSYYAFHPTFHLSQLVYGYFWGAMIVYLPGKRWMNSLPVGLLLFAAQIVAVIWVEHIDIYDPQLTDFQLSVLLTIGRASLYSFEAWKLYACANGRISIVNRFFSSSFWRPLTRLSLGFYLCSTSVLMVRLFSIRQTTTMSPDNMFRAIVSDAVITFILAYVAYVAVQQPVANLMKMILYKKERKSDKLESCNKIAEENNNNELYIYSKNNDKNNNLTNPKSLSSSTVTFSNE